MRTIMAFPDFWLPVSYRDLSLATCSDAVLKALVCAFTFVSQPEYWRHSGRIYCIAPHCTFFTFNAAAVFPFFHMQIVKRFVVLHLQNWSCIRETKSITNTFSELCVCVTGIYIKLYFFLQDICKIRTSPTIFNSHILLCMQPLLRFGSRQSWRGSIYLAHGGLSLHLVDVSEDFFSAIVQMFYCCWYATMLCDREKAVLSYWSRIFCRR